MFASAFRTQARLAAVSTVRIAAAAPSRLFVNRALSSALVSKTPSVPSAGRSLCSTAIRTEEYSAFSRPPVPPSNILFVGNIPWSATEADLREIFEPYGKVSSLRVALDAYGTNRGFCHVEFVDQAAAEAAMKSAAEEPFYLAGRDLRLDYSMSFRKRTDPPSNRLYFHNFEGDRATMVEKLGEYVKHVEDIIFLPENQLSNARPGRRGFLTMTDVKVAAKVIDDFAGKINFNYARARQAPTGQGRERGRIQQDSRDDQH